MYLFLQHGHLSLQAHGTLKINDEEKDLPAGEEATG